MINPATCNAAPSGELVLTTLTRTGSPLLRYRTGDLVARHAPCTTPCACGRSDLALPGGIRGRLDDMLIVRGVNVYPTAVEEILHGFADVAEYRVRVTQLNAMTELQIEIEPIVGCRDASTLAATIARAFETTLALRVPVVVAREPLPHFEMKSKRWLR